MLKFPLIVGTALGLCTVFCAAAAPLRVAVFATEDSEAVARVTAEVSKIRGVEVLERGQIKLLLGEQVPGDTPRERQAFGRLLTADLLLLVESKRNSFAWIDAKTGDELFRIFGDSAGHLAESAVTLVEEQRDAVETQH